MRRIVRRALPAICLCLIAAANATETTRVSESSSGAQGNGPSNNAALSGDGRYAAFVSEATNLVSGDVNGFPDVFVHDKESGSTQLVSVSSAGDPGNRESGEPRLSADGALVVFSSLADNFAGSDNNGNADVFLHDIAARTTTIVSVSSTGARGDNESLNPAISADGNVVAFASTASNLVSGDNNGVRDIFVRDLASGTTSLVSVSSAGAQGDAGSARPALSVDGRYVAFQSSASNLVSGDNNGAQDIFVHDRQTGETRRVSVSSSGGEGNAASQLATISADGRYVAFESGASNLASGDNNGVQDVFVHDRQSNSTEIVSRTNGGALSNGDSFAPRLSADGVLVAFHSQGTNLVSSDSNGVLDVFLRDRAEAATSRLSLSSSDAQANGESARASISEDGRFAAFDSNATNLVSGDSNGLRDVFVRDTSTSVAPTTLVSSLLPIARAVAIGVPATTFASISNTDTATAVDCRIALLDSGLGTFSYQTTDPETNVPTGTADTPVDIPAGEFQSFVISLTPDAALDSVDVQLIYDCTDVTPATIVPGLNTFLLSASSSPSPDAVAIAATPSNDGVIRLTKPPSANAFATSVINSGVAGNVTAAVDTGDAELPLELFICETNLQGECLQTPSTTTTRFLDSNATATYSVFVNAAAPIPADFATNRVFVRHTDDNGVTVGATSVAVLTE